ncbi:MAG: 50S ribosomal protein L11 methyltransferase [Hyphomicrobiaceae bacterium]
MVVRLRTLTADSATARLISDRLAAGEDDDDGAGALATSWFEDPEIKRWQVDAWYAEAPPAEAILARLGRLLPADASLSIEDVPDENWVAISQASLPPVAAGSFVVHGSHDRARIGRRRLAIEIEAGEAFGTAHHATTQGCLGAIDRLSRSHQPESILDLGCGSGILSIAAARVWPAARIVASDIDPVSVEVARANVAHNGERGRVKLVVASGLGHPAIRTRAPFDLVVANILAGPLIRLAPSVARIVRPGGRLVLSGILGEQSREVVGTYALAGFRLEQRTLDHNWATLELIRIAGRSPTRLDETTPA